MSHKRKGLLTVSGEWARDPRPWLRRVFWKAERQAEKRLVRWEERTIDVAAEKSAGTVEALLATIGTLPLEAKQLELWVPQVLTLRGEFVAMDAALWP